MFEIGVSPIGDISAFDPWATVISQYANSPILDALITSFNSAMDPTQQMDEFYDLMWNVYTAQGYGLDAWGRIVGVTRSIAIGSIPIQYFGFDESSSWLSFGGVSGSIGAGIFYSGNVSGILTTVTLNDTDFRTLILAKAAGNISGGSITETNAIILSLFPGLGGHVVDGLNMTMQIVFTSPLTPNQLAILLQDSVLPYPAGGQVSIVQQ